MGLGGRLGHVTGGLAARLLGGLARLAELLAGLRRVRLGQLARFAGLFGHLLLGLGIGFAAGRLGCLAGLFSRHLFGLGELLAGLLAGGVGL